MHVYCENLYMGTTIGIQKGHKLKKMESTVET